ncbi:uncharacterized protein LOC132069797 isoform X2 [Ammospiza nelsoni]|uniref:uncharacterized protein LOC132069797 isoform X2 n=1 Tax=Ammospiza nelsoni TaxID=2857394 RepID=UPI002869D75E|nr:uncharacterized protein LOC132069797 isoform X2 [Ammospiza nelsoni]
MHCVLHSHDMECSTALPQWQPLTASNDSAKPGSNHRTMDPCSEYLQTLSLAWARHEPTSACPENLEELGKTSAGFSRIFKARAKPFLGNFRRKYQGGTSELSDQDASMSSWSHNDGACPTSANSRSIRSAKSWSRE